MVTANDIVAAIEDNITFGFNEIRLNSEYKELMKLEPKLENTVQLFAFGTIEHYFTNKCDFIELSNAALSKLRKLSLVSYALEGNFYTYADLLKKLGLESPIELERLIVESTYDNVLDAKLYNKEGFIRIFSSSGRDVLLEGEDSRFGATKVSDLIEGLDKFNSKIQKAFSYINHIDNCVKEVPEKEGEETDTTLEEPQPRERLSSSASSNAPVPSEAHISDPVVSEVTASFSASSSSSKSSNNRKRKIENK